ncbi:cyclic AMP-responsive element-binding protein 3-like protein 1, partial [Aplochiton taeniatus]
MDSILDGFSSEKLFPTNNLLDLEDLNEGDFLNNVPFSEQMEDFSSDLFSSFFEDQLLERPLLDMDLEDGSSPTIQADHSYSLSGDSAPQSPSLSIKMDQDTEFEGMWTFSQDLTAVLVKQEPVEEPRRDPMALSGGPQALLTLAAPPHRTSTQHMDNQGDANPVAAIKDEPKETGQFLNIPTDDRLQLPPTPPSSHGSDSDGSLPPSSPNVSPSSPQRQQARASAAISTSPLLTAPHKLQGSGPLLLTEEEKRTLVAEGYPVPNKLPLTKSEEKALKRVRRKIKNKISAQESRRKKKEYVECLEKKVENYNSDNNDLWKKVEHLETANRSLLQQLQKLQSLVTGKSPRSCKIASTQTGTCLMVVALCFVLVLGSLTPCLPNLSFLPQAVPLSSSSSSSSPSFPLSASSSPPLHTADLYTSSQVRSRSLLFFDEDSPLEESFVMSEGEGWERAERSKDHTHLQATDR